MYGHEVTTQFSRFDGFTIYICMNVPFARGFGARWGFVIIPLFFILGRGGRYPVNLGFGVYLKPTKCNSFSVHVVFNLQSENRDFNP